MKHISILIPVGEIIQNTVISVIGAYKMFTVVNQYYVSIGKKPAFKVELVGNSKIASLTNGMAIYELRDERGIYQEMTY